MTAAAGSEWDVIVIGTGIGGATTGRALAEAGQKVLFLEKGLAERITDKRLKEAAADRAASAKAASKAPSIS